MRLNMFNLRPGAGTPLNHEGMAAAELNTEQRLRRSVGSCLLWEDEFYEDGVVIADRLSALAAEVPPALLADLAIEAREVFNLRHAPLLLLVALTRTGVGTSLVAQTIERVIQRADELTEFLSIYWRHGKKPLTKQMKLGLARAFAKFDAYQLAKYDRDGPIKLRDVLFLVHAKPKDEAQAALWKRVADRTLPAPDTWEVGLSGGGGKKETFERLLRDGKLGYLALLRNLRNMDQAGVEETLVREAILARKGAHRILPFRYVAAARAAPRFEPWLDEALMEAVLEGPVLPGRTIVLVDISPSMNVRLSARSDLTRMDAAAALASVIPGDLRVFSFSNEVVEVPARRGMAGVDAVLRSQPSNGTLLGKAVSLANQLPHDRLIVVTDEQSQDTVPAPKAKLAYMVNVASARNGVGYGPWIHIDGFSEAVIRFMHQHEALTGEGASR